MIPKYRRGSLPSLFSAWRRKTPESKKAPSIPFEACWTEASPHLDAVFSDALCLTGSEDAAADLVVETYRRTFRDWLWERQPVDAESLQTQDTLAYLYRNLYAAFCDRVLACAARHDAPPKE